MFIITCNSALWISFQVTIAIKWVLISYLYRRWHISIATAWVGTPDNKGCEEHIVSRIVCCSFYLFLILFPSLFVPDGYAELHILISIKLFCWDLKRVNHQRLVFFYFFVYSSVLFSAKFVSRTQMRQPVPLAAVWKLTISLGEEDE